MTSLYDLILILQTWIEDESIDDAFLVFLMFSIEQAEKLVDWANLYGEKTVTVGTDGIITIPAECRKLLSIYSADDSSGTPAFRFSMVDDEPTLETGGMIQYSAEPYLPVAETLATFTPTVTQGSAVLTDTADAVQAWVGERVMIGNAPDLYEVVSVVDATSVTLSQPVPFATTSATVTYPSIVGPVGMERFILQNRQSTPWSGDVVVKYQRRHPSLVRESDRLLIPCPQTVALVALQNALRTDKYNVDADRLENSVVLARADEVGTSPFSKKKNIFKDSTFSVRSKSRYGRNSRRR